MELGIALPDSKNRPLLLRQRAIFHTRGSEFLFSRLFPLAVGVGDVLVPLLPLAQEIKKLGLNLFIYTGSIFEKLIEEQDPDVMALLQEGDFLVDGPFVLAQRDLTLLFRGSQNQRILDLPQSLAQGKAVLAPIGQ